MAFIYQSAIHSTPRLKSLLVTSQPTKTNYASGDVFDPTGMAITAIYTNGSTKTITDYTYSPTRPLNENDTEITVSYTEKGITKTTIITISVESILSSIAVTKMPNKTVYLYKDSLSTAGMEVTATFSNGSQRTVSGWTVDTTTLTSLGSNTITVSYSTGGITKTTTMTVTVNAITLIVPSQSNNLVYNGQSQSPTWNNYNSSQLTIGGTTSGINASGYTATFTPEYGYMWSGGVTTAKSVNWQINRATITTVPSQSGTLTYSGRSQSPTWNNYNSSQLTIGGATSSTNAGTYTATFTPTSNYMWSGGVTTAKSVNWQINKRTPVLRVIKKGSTSGIISSLTFNTTNSDTSYCLILDGDVIQEVASKGVPQVSNSNPSVVQVSAGGPSADWYSSLTFVPQSSGSTTITFTSRSSSNYNSSSERITIYVEVHILENDSWETIADNCQYHNAKNYYAIGDTKTIKLSTGFEVQAFIIGINHNMAYEEYYGDRDTLHFQIGKKNGKLITLPNMEYGHTLPNTEISMTSIRVHAINRYGDLLRTYGDEAIGNSASGRPTNGGFSNYPGGWAGSWMLNYVLNNNVYQSNSLYTKLPSSLQNAIKKVYKYQHNITVDYNLSGSSSVAVNNAYISTTYTDLFLLSEYEYLGTCVYSNPQEANRQLQYEYYKLGNSRIHYSSSNNNLAYNVWTRSAATNAPGYNNDKMCYISTSGQSRYAAPNLCYAISPAFVVSQA